ncbi:hypothetical protein [Bdellovibrio sp. HCB337]|uniref:hypothetical protein n=1 Tax=Bdellovibrio sp. HCB337 TaxID=3394358 RepID=UPI0039A4D5D2
MKAVTEFASFTLAQALKTKAALAAEGKSAEEIQASLGTTYKLEGDKLTYFVNALEIADKNAQGLKRVLVVSYNDGETVPAQATKVEEMYYLPEMFITAKPVAPAKDAKGGRGGGRGGKGGGGPKGSPWGLSPEEQAMKNKPKTTT